MKHQLIGAAMLGALSTAAAAQSNVTVYGSIDAGLRNETNVNAAGDDNLTMGSNGTFRSNRLGFKGKEALGGGLSAHFVLESGFNTATGELNNTTGQLFQREALVGVAGSFGEIELGRQYTVAFKTLLNFDPFGFRYPSITYALSATAGTRNSNDIQYTGNFGNVTLNAEYALGEVAGSLSNGAKQAIGATYASGPFKIGASYTRGDLNIGTAAAPSYQDFDHIAVGGAYRIGDATVSLGYVDQKQATATRDNTSKWTWAGVSYKLTPQVGITGAWYRIDAFNTRATAAVAAGDGKKDLYMIGATYNLSKRTTLYSEIDFTRLSGAYATGGTTRLNQDRQTGVSVGIMHVF
ncbi:porin [Noviherbaspirillum sp.]|uniref:porin n=1 Tax=Noviherbaspirillum sp. TaxID=1926288 RepID=UPI002FE04619